uniref:ComF family protein n=1 Tax=Streptomyces sp. SM12 TaxID=1071602 RepID=UPI0035B62722
GLIAADVRLPELARALAARPLPGVATSTPLLLVPVPSARAATARRGHDPLRRITLAAAGQLRASGRAVRMTPLLRQRRAVADQVGLDRAQRHANLDGALAAHSGRSGGPGRAGPPAPMVLVDDLLTTGASLAEAVRALRAGSDGHGLVVAAAVIATPLRHPIGGTRR